MDPLTFQSAGMEPLTEDEVNRLIVYVRFEPKSREHLKRDLDVLRCWCWMFRGPYPTQTAVRYHAKQVENATRRLLDLIDPNDRDGAWRDITGPASEWSLADRMPDLSFPSRPSLAALRNGLKYLHDLSRQLQERIAPTSELAQLLNATGSTFDSCIGDLARIYKEQFGSNAGGSRHADGEPYGPFLDFAEFCINQLKLIGDEQIYQKETIIRSLSKMRSRQKRLSQDK